MTSANQPLAESVALGCRILGREGITRGMFGHVSARGDDGTILIKARGFAERAPEFTESADVIRVDPVSGEAIGAAVGQTPPLELPIHTALYKARPDVGAVVHAHPPEIVAISAAGLELVPIYGAYDPLGFAIAHAGVPVYTSCVLIDTDDLGREVSECLDTKRACILHGHGIVTVGIDVIDAVESAIAVRELAHLTLLVTATGTLAPTSARDAERLSAQLNRIGFGHRTAGQFTSTLRYYAERLGHQVGLEAQVSETP